MTEPACLQMSTRQAKETYTIALVDNDYRRFHAIGRSSRMPDRYTLAYQ